MNLNHRGSILLLLIVMLALGASAASAGPNLPNLPLYSPPDNVTLWQPEVNFTWSDSFGAKARILVRSTDGKQTIAFKVNAAPCIAGACSTFFTPADHGWAWREGTAYKWQVRTLGGKKVVAKSGWNRLTTDFFAPPALSGPDHGATWTNDPITFSWLSDSGVDQYRFVMVRPNGTKFKSQWTYRDAHCNSTCNFDYNFTNAPDGVYKWRVVGRAFGVKTKVKSPQRRLTIQ